MAEDIDKLNEKLTQVEKTLANMKEYYGMDQAQQFNDSLVELNRKFKWTSYAQMFISLIPTITTLVLAIYVTKGQEAERGLNEKRKIAANLYAEVTNDTSNARMLNTAELLRYMIPEDSSFTIALNKIAISRSRVQLSDSTIAKTPLLPIDTVQVAQRRAEVQQLQNNVELSNAAIGPVSQQIAKNSNSRLSAIKEAARPVYDSAFENLARGDVQAANLHFQKSEKIYPSGFMAYELSGYTRTLLKEYPDGKIPEQKKQEVLDKVVNNYSWGMSKESKMTLNEANALNRVARDKSSQRINNDKL